MNITEGAPEGAPEGTPQGVQVAGSAQVSLSETLLDTLSVQWTDHKLEVALDAHWERKTVSTMTGRPVSSWGTLLLPQKVVKWGLGSETPSGSQWMKSSGLTWAS